MKYFTPKVVYKKKLILLNFFVSYFIREQFWSQIGGLVIYIYLLVYSLGYDAKKAKFTIGD
jgi:hypothetical protein